MSYRTDRVRLVILVKRKPGLSKEEFQKYWSETHGPLFASLDIAKKKLFKYEQAHTNHAVLEQMAQMTGAPIPDGMVCYANIFEVCVAKRGMEGVIFPDSEVFMDTQTLQMLPLDLITVLDK
ncbi:hypothetical protein K438DRAFT_1816945 [Mycena galopus ATCC 62051]|nr:hypothetical protein K438DRAFT_1816945 [Mycena galopus ATCC 62051]